VDTGFPKGSCSAKDLERDVDSTSNDRALETGRQRAILIAVRRQVGTAERRPHIAAMSQAIRRLCPICGNPALEAVRPFCSRRCADVDLNRWLSGAYAIPATEDEEEDERRDEGAANNSH
jgi:uncharacterized protein